MEVKRICQWCGKPFIAQKTTPNYCSPQCSKRGYKHRMKERRMELRQIQEMVEVKKKLESQEYFTFSQTAKLMGVSRQYIYKLVKEDKLRASRLSSRMSLIRRADIELMLKTKPYESIKPKDDVDITEYYTAEQIAEKYKVNAKWVWTYTREHDVPKVKIRQFNYYSKKHIDAAFAKYEVDSDLMIEYETYLKSRGVCPNTSSYYMRGLRAIYNRAVEKGMTVQRDPFKYVYTGIGKTVKRAVPLKVIRRIRDMDLALFPAMDFARDIFMFSFYTRGMSFIDMAYLKKKDLQNGILSYRRQKTGQQLFVKWEKPMQEIVDKYDTVSTPYLLPVIKDMNADARRQYKNAAHLVNDKLKKLGVRLGLDIPLTSYVARHGWASIARSRNIPLATISEAMGHDSEKTTRIYLASLDTSSVDKANSQILKAL